MAAPLPGHVARLLFRDERRQEPVKFRLWKTGWIDPYPYVPGTVPEKMVFAELMYRRLQFVFQAEGFPPEHPNGPHFIARLDSIRPDFLIPSVKAVIEVQGTYFHTQPEAEQHDLDKLTEYKAWGWYVYWIFDTDILLSAAKAVEQAPEATGHGPTLGSLIPKATEGTFSAPGATTADANAVAAANQKRARRKAPTLTARRNRGRRRGRVKLADPVAAPLPKATPLNLGPTARRAIIASQKALKAAPKKKRR